MRLEDFAEKWLILDFWTAHCVSCVKGFQHLDTLQKEFNQDLKFILIGDNSSPYQKLIRDIYHKYQQKYNLNLTSAYDSALFDRFGVWAVPHLIWIDNHGVVRAITTQSELTKTNILTFLAGKELNIEEAPDLKTKQESNHPFERNKPLLIEGNGGNDSDFIYRSVLTKSSRKVLPGMPPIWYVFRWKDKDVFQATCASLNQLYNVAYRGSYFYTPKDSLYKVYYPEPVVEATDPEPFDIYKNLENKTYCYSFIFPSSKYSVKLIQETLQHDLHTYLGYVANVENRIMPYWKLTCNETEKEKLRARGNKLENKVNENSYTLAGHRTTMQSVILTLYGFNQDAPPFIDETGINFEILLKHDFILTDFEDMKRGLEKNGLHLEKGTREMKVIVIRNSPDEYTGDKPLNN